MNKETLVSFRYCFQTILVPCIVFIGVLGNSVSVLVLTRKRMRSSTNIYLTALAIADIIYLMLVLSLSFQHYKHMHHPKFEVYWRTYGLQCWFCDAASYSSIYITVSFTIERYIAVCHPIRGQVLCTESKAKKVISAVVIMSLFCTCTTPFEYLLSYTPQYLDVKTYETCTPSALNDSAGMQLPVPNCTLPWTTQSKAPTPSLGESADNSTILPENLSLFNQTNSNAIVLARASKLATSNSTRAAMTDSPSSTTNCDNSYQSYGCKDYLAESSTIHQEGNMEGVVAYNKTIFGDNENKMNVITDLPTVGHTELAFSTRSIDTMAAVEVKSSSSSPSLSITNIQDNCVCFYYLEAKSSSLGDNETYITVFMWITSVVFTFIPLILLITFNTFLVLAVRESNKSRNMLTNLSSRKIKNKISSISQENKITVTLIAVVILFIICQTPTAVYIIVKTSMPQELPPNIQNLHLALGNIFNFLITFNAASNFFLYCALSEKYRQTVKELVMGRKHKRQATLNSLYLNRHGTINESLYSSNSQRTIPSSRHFQLALNEPNVPDSETSQQLHNPPAIVSSSSKSKGDVSVSKISSTKSDRPMIKRDCHKRNSFHHDPIPEHRVSDPIALQLCRKHSGPPSIHCNVEGNSGIHGPLKSSESSSSLTRSQSMIIEPKIRHSPNCKKYNNL